MNLIDYQAQIFYYIFKEQYHEAVLSVRQIQNRFDEPMLQVWTLYSNYKLGKNEKTSFQDNGLVW